MFILRSYRKKNGMTTPYWAIILKSTTVIFQQPEGKEKEDDEETTISQWYDAVKAKFTMGMFMFVQHVSKNSTCGNASF